jgi:rubrerythrin
MNLKLFASTFVLIFLAELGDKTQLAAMARAAAGGHAKWTVFLGASAALVLATLIAVLFGAALTRVVPESYIKIAAGILFIGFGIAILIGAFRAQPQAAAAPRPGMLTDAVFRMAAEFEAAAAADYRRLAATASSPELRRLLTFLAEEEHAHLERVRHHGAATDAPSLPMDPAALEAVRPPVAVAAQTDGGGGGGDDDGEVLRRAAEHEAATARFYEELARAAPLPALRDRFAALAAEERRHEAQLRRLLKA